MPPVHIPLNNLNELYKTQAQRCTPLIPALGRLWQRTVLSVRPVSVKEQVSDKIDQDYMIKGENDLYMTWSI